MLISRPQLIKASALFSLTVLLALPFALRSEAGALDAKGAPPAAPQVQVQTLHSKNVTLWKEYSGRLTAVNLVQVRPRASGAITAIKFEDGAMVKAGDELFTIDTRPYEAEMAKGRAALVSAQSQARLAQVELDRAKALVAQQHVSKSIYDQRASAQQVANAAIGSAVAQLKQTELYLEYAHVKAPISGRIGRAEITLGNVVEAGPSAPILATILADDKIYAEFDVDEQAYLTSIRRTQSGGKKSAVEVTLTGDEKVYHGNLHSFDNHLDSNSGTIRARALLENSDGALIPGMYAKIRLQSDSGVKVLVPESAISTDQDKKYVLVVDDKNMIAYRPVTLGQQHQDMRVVISGVSEGDRVIVSGQTMLRPGMPVQPVEASEAPPQPPKELIPPKADNGK